jgi:hypothetical protein
VNQHAIWEKILWRGKKSQTVGGYNPPLMRVPHQKNPHVFRRLSTGIQSTRKRRCDLKPAFFREINSGVNVAFSARQLHALYVLQHLAVFQTLVFGQVLFVTVFTWR